MRALNAAPLCSDLPLARPITSVAHCCGSKRTRMWTSKRQTAKNGKPAHTRSCKGARARVVLVLPAAASAGPIQGLAYSSQGVAFADARGQQPAPRIFGRRRTPPPARAAHRLPADAVLSRGTRQAAESRRRSYHVEMLLMSAVAAVLPALALAQAPAANTPWHTEPEPMTAEDKVCCSPGGAPASRCAQKRSLIDLDSRAVLRPAGV